MNNPRVFWTPEEKEAILQEALRLRRSDKTLSVLRAFEKAQSVLSADRHRKFHNGLTSIGSGLPVRLNELEKQSAAPTLPQPEPAPPQPSPVSTSKHLDLESALDVLVDTFAAEIANRLEQKLRSRIKAVVERVAEAAPTLRRKVLLVGAIGSQVTILEQEFGKVLDLRTLSTDAATKRGSNEWPQADAIVVWTNFIGHNITEKVPREKMLMVSGGMTEIRETLRRLIPQ